MKLTPSACGAFFEAKRALEERLGQRLSDAEVMEAMCADVLAGGDGGSKKAPYQVALSVCPHCDRTRRDSAGEVIDVSPAMAEMARCDGDWLDEDGHIHAAIPAAVRRLVLARDHHRCHGGGHDPRNLITLCLAHHTALHDDNIIIRGTAPHALAFMHDDGRAYGTESAHVCADTAADALSALTNLGFRTAEAKAALDRALERTPDDAPLDAVVRACLAELRPPGTKQS